MSRRTAFPIGLYVRPAKTQINLRIRAVWSEASQGAFRIAKEDQNLHYPPE